MNKKGVAQHSGSDHAKRYSFPAAEAGLPWLSVLFDAYEIIDRGVSIAVGREKRKHKKRPACSEGCDVCCRCNTDIPVYPLELAGITWYATEKIEQSPVRDLLKEQLSANESRPPCPFLVDHSCSVYPVRPIACRQYIVFGRACAENEDPFYSRREDLLTPIQNFMDDAVYTMLPFYGISGEEERRKAVADRFIHSKIQNMFSCNWNSLRIKMDRYDDPRNVRNPGGNRQNDIHRN